MNYRLFKVFVVVFIGFGCIFFGCREKKVIARVGNHLIYLKDLNSYIRSSHGASVKKVNYDMSKQYLNNMIDEYVKLIDAYAHHLNEDPDIEKAAKKSFKKDMYQAVIADKVIDKVISDDQIRENYNHKLKEVKLYHIFLPMAKNAPDSVKSVVVSQLNGLRKQMREGADFQTLARKFSKDSLTAGKGGELGFVKWGKRGFGTSFYHKVFNMKEGQISKPIQSQYGFHLVKVDKIRPVEQPPYKFEREKIQRSLFRSNSQELEKVYNKFSKGVLKNYNCRYNDINIDSLSVFIIKKYEKNPFCLLNDFLSDSLRDKPLVEYNNGQFTVADFVSEIDIISPERRPTLESRESVDRLLKRIFTYELLIQFGYDKGYHRKNELHSKYLTLKEGLMIRQIENLQINEKLDSSEEVYRDYYEKNKSQYMEPVKVKVQEIQVKDIGLANQILSRAIKGESFDRLAEKYNQRSATKNNKGILGYITRIQYGPIGSTAVNMEENQISDVIKYGSMYSVIKILEKPAPVFKDYNLVKSKVIGDYKTKMRDQLDSAWKISLKKQIPVQVYNGVLKKEFQS